MMNVFINRTLNMKKIKAIGFDMDYTIVRYNTEAFEEFTYNLLINKLIEVKNYPESLKKLKFDFNLAIQGLTVDKKRGNLLKVSRYGKVKEAHHGTRPMAFREMQAVYRGRVIDLSEHSIQSLDTNFSISNGVLYAQLVDLKSEGVELPDFYNLADELKEVLDIIHNDGSLKGEVRKNIDKYIIQDPEVVELLERYKDYGKKLLVITNSDYSYTKLLLDHTITPFLKEHKCWSELFDMTITSSRKPLFFTTDNPFLTIDPKTGMMENQMGKIKNGIYQGGWAGKLQDDLGLQGDEILYLGDHIYGDVVSIKKTFNWRTALVLDPLIKEVQSIRACVPIQEDIDKSMVEKRELEKELNRLEGQKYEGDARASRDQINSLYGKIDRINTHISEKIDEYRKQFNPHWGEMMRAGQEESRFADQVEKYACIYMAKVTDLLLYSPRNYFRPRKRVLPHEEI